MLLERLLDVPAPIRGLAPGRPVEGDVGDDAGRKALAGQAVARLPDHVAEEHVHLEVLLEGLPLQQRAPSKASRSALMASVNTWSSMSGARLLPRAAAGPMTPPAVKVRAGRLRALALVQLSVLDRVATLTLEQPGERNTHHAADGRGDRRRGGHDRGRRGGRGDRRHRRAAGVLRRRQPGQPAESDGPAAPQRSTKGSCASPASPLRRWPPSTAPPWARG